MPSATTRYTAQITTVNQPQNQVGFVIKGDAQERQALVVTVPVAWRWPEPGETWLVKQENGTWYLDGVLPTADYQDIEPGDAIINAPTGIVHVLGSDTGASDFDFSSASFGFMGAGAIMPITGNTVPSGWLTCDGSSYSTGAYPLLYAVIGHTYGGSGATFKVPNLGGPALPTGPPLVWIISTGIGTPPPPSTYADYITSSTPLGGDLSGVLPDPTVSGIMGIPLPSTPPTAGEVLTALSSTSLTWSPASGGSGGTAGGDLSGTYPNPTVAHVLGGKTPITTTTAGTGDISGSSTFGSPIVSTVLGGQTPITSSTGAGGDLSGTYPNPTVTTVGGHTPLTNASAAGGDLSGTYPNPTVAKVNGVSVTGTASSGEVLTATGSTTANWQATANVTNWLQYVRTATSGSNLASLSGLLTIDGVTVAAGDRVLVKDQSTQSQNGVYIAASGAWSRSTDLNTWTQTLGAVVIVGWEPITTAGSLWASDATPGGTIGTTALAWSSIPSYTSIGTTLPGGVLAASTRLDQIATYNPATSAVDMNSKRVTSVADPTSAQDAATKNYVDSKAWKQACVAATTANITLSGTQTIDGVACVAGNRVLVKNQTTSSQNGIYVVASGSWTRDTDMTVWSQVPSAIVPIMPGGSVNANTTWTPALATTTGTINSTSMPWQSYSVQAIDGVTVSGTPTSGQAIVATGVNAATWQTVSGGGGSGGATVAARGYRSAAFTLTGGSTTKIPIDTVSFDTSGMVSTANGRINILTSGYYQVDAECEPVATADAQVAQVAIYKNGAQVSAGSWSQGSANGQGIATVANDTIYCNAGDYLELWCYSPSSLVVYVGAGSICNYLSVSLLTSLPGALGTTTPARAYRNAAFTFGAATWTKMPVDTVAFDPGSLFSLTNSRYIVPATGYYQVSGQIAFNASGATQLLAVAIYKNGASVSNGTSIEGIAGEQIVSTSDIISCNAGDYLELWGYSGNGSAVFTGTQNDYLSVVQVGNQYLTSLGGTPGATVTAKGARNASLTLTANVWTVVPLDTVVFDTTGMINTTTGKMTAATAGYYQVNGEVIINPGGSGTNSIFSAGVYVNGAVVSAGNAQSNIDVSGYMRANVSDVIKLNAGDQVQLIAFAPTAWNVLSGNAGPYNYLSMTLLTSLPGALGTTTPAKAYRNAAYTLNTGSWGVIPIDTISFDPGSNINLTTNRYVVPATGYYQINAQVCFTIVAGYEYAAGLYKNGALVSQGAAYLPRSATTGDPYDATASDILFCNAGDYIQLAGYANTASALSVGGAWVTYLSVTQVGNQYAVAAPTAPGPARGWRNGALTISGSTWTKVPIDTISYDPSGMCDVITNHRINIPVSGYYQVNAATLLNISGTPAYSESITAVYHNGVQGPSSATNSAMENYDGHAVADVIYCASGDYLELYVYSQGGGTIFQSTQYTFLSASYVGTVAGATAPVTMARAYRTAAFTLTAGYANFLPDTISFDPGGHFNTSTGLYTCPATGYYQVNAQICANTGSGTTGDYFLNIMHNGSADSQGSRSYYGVDTNAVTNAVVSNLVYANAGDTIGAQVYSTQAWGVLVGTPAVNYISVVQVGNSMNFTAAGGDLAGTYPNPTIAVIPGYNASIQSADITSAAGSYVYWTDNTSPTLTGGMLGDTAHNGAKVPKAGWYTISFYGRVVLGVTSAGNGGIVTLEVWDAGRGGAVFNEQVWTVPYVGTTSSQNTWANFSIAMELTAGQYVFLRGTATGASNTFTFSGTGGGTNSRLSVAWLGHSS